jgi:RNA recognition motif-containing protein
MVVSLYICQIPENVTKEDLISAFSEVSGYIDTRIKLMPDKSKIAFIDFEDEKNANFAKETLQGFKFTEEDKGIIIKFSENARFSKIKKNNNSEYSSKKRKRSFSNERIKNNEDLNNKKNSPNNDNNSQTNNSINNNLIETLINNPLLKLIENSNNQILPNQNPQSNLIKNLTLLAGINNNMKNSNINNNENNKNNKNSQNNIFKKYEDEFYDFENLKKNATNIVYVEGIPIDATEREVAHIFRPFPGYKSLRLIQKEKNGENTYLCFVDFENSYQSTICINTLQGYRFDKSDLVGLHCSYGINKNKKF